MQLVKNELHHSTESLLTYEMILCQCTKLSKNQTICCWVMAKDNVLQYGIGICPPSWI